MPSQSKDLVLLGSIIYPKALNDLQILSNGCVVVKNGKIIHIGEAPSSDELPKLCSSLGMSCDITKLSSTQFLIPGFIDCHIHAPQMPNIGLGSGIPLLEWLDRYTFPLETKYADVDFATRIYNAVVKRTLTCGTTTASYFATIHKESTLELAKACHKQGQRALIGKVNMNSQNPSYYREETQESIQDTINIVQAILGLKSNLVKPIITPRFTLSCDMHLMTELSIIARDHNLHIQSHISENRAECKAVSEVYKKNSCYADVYDEAKLLTKKTILAHGVYLTSEELNLLKKRGTSVAHCPSSNTFLASGLCNVRRLLEAGVTVGLGTDVAGGSSTMILDAMRRAMDVSQHLAFLKEENKICDEMLINEQTPLSYANVLYLATLGGAKALSLDDQIGNFEVGKDFDALLIDIDSPNSPIDIFDLKNSLPSDTDETSKSHCNISNYLQKFIFCGDDRNIIKVFVAGRQVKSL